MNITALNEYYYNNAASKKAGEKQNSSTEKNIADGFKNKVLDWEKKNKQKIDEELENDRENNIKMSDKKWHALMNKVDSAINMNSRKVKENTKVNCVISNNEAETIKNLYIKDETVVMTEC